MKSFLLSFDNESSTSDNCDICVTIFNWEMCGDILSLTQPVSSRNCARFLHFLSFLYIFVFHNQRNNIKVGETVRKQKINSDKKTFWLIKFPLRRGKTRCRSKDRDIYVDMYRNELFCTTLALPTSILCYISSLILSWIEIGFVRSQRRWENKWRDCYGDAKTLTVSVPRERRKSWQRQCIQVMNGALFR